MSLLSVHEFETPLRVGESSEVKFKTHTVVSVESMMVLVVLRVVGTQ